jgi:hypothetical protein
MLDSGQGFTVALSDRSPHGNWKIPSVPRLSGSGLGLSRISGNNVTRLIRRGGLRVGFACCCWVSTSNTCVLTGDVGCHSPLSDAVGLDSGSVADGEVAHPCRHAALDGAVVAHAVSVGNVARAAEEEEDGHVDLGDDAVGVAVVEVSRVEDAVRLDSAVGNHSQSLGSAARHARGGDAAGVHVGVRALSGVADGPVNGLLHLLGVGGSALARLALRDEDDAPAGDLEVEVDVAQAVGRARTVAPDHDGHLGKGVHVLGPVDGVPAEARLDRVHGLDALGRRAARLRGRLAGSRRGRRVARGRVAGAAGDALGVPLVLRNTGRTGSARRRAAPALPTTLAPDRRLRICNAGQGQAQQRLEGGCHFVGLCR